MENIGKRICGLNKMNKKFYSVKYINKEFQGFKFHCWRILDSCEFFLVGILQLEIAGSSIVMDCRQI